MDKETFMGIFGLIWAGNLLLTLVIGTVGNWLNYTLRSKTEREWVTNLQYLKWGWGGYRSRDRWSAGGNTFTLILGDILLVGAILSAVASASWELGFTHIGYLLGSISIVGLLIFAPRFIIDIIKGLKYNIKTGEVDRIAKLERDYAELLKSKGEV